MICICVQHEMEVGAELSEKSTDVSSATTEQEYQSEVYVRVGIGSVVG